MRKRRVILFDDEPIVLDVMRMYFEERGYEVMTFREPVICAIYGTGEPCTRAYPCSDILITDYQMPRMNGADLLLEQQKHGCRLTPRNKALMSGYVNDEHRKTVLDLGAAFFSKPIEFKELGRWLDECETRVDLGQRLAVKRRDARHACGFEVRYGIASDDISRTAVAVNISAAGLCIKTDAPLRHHQRISVATTAKHTPHLASVRWVKESGPGTYLVGLHFNA